MLSPPQEIPILPHKPLIIHNDLDGILTYLFLRKKGYELAGIYDLETLYMKEKFSPHDCFAVDLDITHPKIASLGHHYTLFGEECHINANHLFSLVNEENPLTQFTSKCPIPTILLLYYLTNTPLPKHPLKRALLIYADGLHQSFHSYKKNVMQWLTALGFVDLLQEMMRNQYETEIQQIVEIVNRFGFKPSTKKPYPQCSFSPQEFDKQLPFINEIAKIFGDPPIQKLPSLKPHLKGERYSFFYDPETHKALKQKYAEWELFSHGMIYMNQIEVTLLTPLQQGVDDLLISRLKHLPWRTYRIA